MTLSSKQTRYLRSLGHHLEPVVMLGREGVTDNVVAALERALFDHELVKVRIGKNTLEDRAEAAEALAAETKSEIAQTLGNTVLFFKARPKKPKIKLPE